MRLDVELERELERVRQDAERQGFERFPPGLMTWVAALPEWTDALARQLGGPWAGADVEAVVLNLECADFVERAEKLAPDGALVEAFWVRDGVRPKLGAHLRATYPGVERSLAELSEALQRSGAENAAAGVESWQRAYRTTDPSGARLLEEVDAMVTAGAIDRAFELVTAARTLGDVRGGGYANAAKRAQWRIDRAYRELRDTHYLRFYQERAAVERAVAELLDPSATQWALHLLGSGGVGKTMMVRYLASGEYARRHGHQPFPVGRVDFDHLDARYPEQRPGELLLALAGELTGFAATRSGEQWYRRFEDAADRLHEELARPEQDSRLVDELLDAVVGQFGRFLRELSPPTVLVLDTCEELAKLYVAGAPAPAIERTFEILERLKGAYPPLRVVLAGRRPLVEAPGDGSRPAGPVLRERGYVRVVPVSGFDPRDAEAYLRLRQAGGHLRDAPARSLSPELVYAILERAREGDGRFNPFELASYVQWALRDEDLTPELLRSSPGNPYVQHRIIGRLSSADLRAALPAAAELGRFDLDLIAPALRREGLRPADVFARLAAEEWVTTVDVTADGRPRVIEVNAHLLGRLRAAIAADPQQFPIDRGRLGRDAAALVLGAGSAAAVNPSAVDAAVRLQPMEAAGELWATLERRLVEEQAWSTAETVAALVGAAAAQRAETGGPTILAAITATQAAARIHADEPLGLADLWANVERLAARHPDPEQRRVLVARAVCGRIAWAVDGRDPGDDDRRALAGALADVGGTTPPGAALAALERVGAAFAPEATAALCRVDHPAIRAAALMLRAWSSLEREPAAARADAEAAVEAAAAAQASCPPTADWRAPRRLVDRCRMLQVHASVVTGEAPDAALVAEWRAEAARHARDIDAERLLARSLAAELDWGVVPGRVLESLEAAAVYVPGRLPSAFVHRHVEPLVVALADGWAALGQPARAAQLLRAARDAAVAAGNDPTTIDTCELALVRLCRRYRDPAYAPLGELARDPRDELAREATIALALVGRDAAPSAAPPVPPPDTQVSLFGPRAAGMSLLAAGEVEALSDPASAVTSLRIAADALAGAGDDLAAGQARVLATLAAFRAGKAVGPAEISSSALDRAIDEGDPAWSAWSERLSAARAWAHGRPVSTDDDVPELRARPATGPRRPVAPRVLKRRGRRNAFVISAVFLFVVTPLASLSEWTADPWQLVSYLVGASLSLLFYSWAVSAFLGPGRYYFWSGRGWTIRITASGAASATLSFRRRRRRTDLDRPGYRYAWQAVLGREQPVKFERTVDLTADVPSQLRLDRLRLPRWWRLLVTALALEIDRPLEHHPWEQWLGTTAPRRAASAHLWFRREVTSSDRRQFRLGLFGVRRKLWRWAAVRYLGPRHIAVSSDPAADSEALVPHRVVHLVGTPVDTTAGWRFRVADDRLSDSQVQTRGAALGESLIGADDLPARTTALFVLQSEPVDTPARSLATDRVGVLGFARSLLDAGADAVLVVPPLPDDAAASVVREVRRQIAERKRPPLRWQLLVLLADVKAIVARAEDDGAQSRERAVLDTTLWMPTIVLPHDHLPTSAS